MHQGAQSSMWHTRAMRYETLIGLRYTLARNRGGSNPFISFISLASMLGIALGVAALIVVLSVMNGFQKELRTRILGVASHVQVTGPDNQLADWKAIAAQASARPRVLAAAPFVNAQAMLSAGSAVRGALVRGIDPALELKVADFGGHMRSGSLEALRAGEFGIVLGGDLSRILGVRLGDTVAVIAPQGLVTPAGVLPRLKQFRVVGIFQVDHYEYDSALALVHIEDAQRLYQLGDKVSGVRLKLDDLFASRQVVRDLVDSIRADIYVSDWTKVNANFFRAVEIEKRVMFIILMLIVAVAAFNLVSTLVMAVTDKQADIAILRALGASPGSIMRIFVVQGAVTGVAGTLAGVLGGVLLALNIDVVVPFIERTFSVQFLARDVYFITELPSDLHRSDVLVVTAVSLVMALLATLYPSWRASRVNPAEALRYE